MNRFVVSTFVALLILTASVGLAAGTPSPMSPAAQPLTGDRLASFEADVRDLLAAGDVPGAAIAVVQGGETVYLEGFGMRQLGSVDPVTPDTLMMVGSTQKSMTSLLAATLVDAGLVAWDTPLTDLLPGFATADPDLTRRLTMADAFCACSGIPRRDLEFLFNAGDLSAEDLIATIAGIAPVAPFGETFQYSNQIYAAGGYAVAGVADSRGSGLYDSYVAAMQQRVLSPIGMAASTFDLAAVRASGNYAYPHGTAISGAYQALDPGLEAAAVHSVAPAGAIWSNARDMARYLQTLTSHGVTPDGARLVSLDNLAVLWTQRVASDPADMPNQTLAEAYAGYGLGWVTGAYRGQPMVSHTGGTLAFTAQIAVWPEADLGIVVLTNAQGAELIVNAIQFRLAEIVFEQPDEIMPLVRAVLAAGEEQAATRAAQVGTMVAPSAVTGFPGRYVNPVLGSVELSLVDGRLVLDTGTLSSELRPMLDGPEAVTAYVAVDPPLAGMPVILRHAGARPELVVPDPAIGEEHVFTPD